MDNIALFSLERKSGGGSGLLFERRLCAVVVPGVALEAQYRLDNGFYLLFITDECPFEEFLHIVLLDDQFRRLDCIDIGFAYSAAVFSDLRVLSPRALVFDFYTGFSYRLSIELPGVRLLCARPLPEVRYDRSLFARKFLRIERIKRLAADGL